jgi:tetratricopeptide (TPR) repeat protein
MQQQKFLEVFENLPTKRKQVLLGTLKGDAREKLMADLGLSEAALTQHRRQLYKDFQIENLQNEADDPRSGERKLPQLIALCAKYKPELVSPHPVLTAPPRLPTDATWVERPELTATLLPQLQQCRIVALTGMTGIGKTALAERLVRLLPDSKPLKTLNLDIGGIAPEFASSGAALLRVLGEEPTLEDQKDARNLLNHLLQLLRTQPYRVQIDSMERLLKGNDQEGWSDFCDPLWLDLLQELLAGDCQSQIILTTQDVPGELEAIGSRYPHLWHCQSIRGLNEEEQLQLFQKRGVIAISNATVAADNCNVTADNPNAEGQHGNVTTDSAITAGQHQIAGADSAIAGEHNRIAEAHNHAEAVSLLKRIGKLYAGHPLVLRVIAEDLKACGNDVKRYWQQGKFAELEANCPAQLSRRKLQLGVKQRVKDSIARLTETARQLLCRSAVFRRPVPEAFWLAMLPDSPHAQAALELLKSRALTEEDWEPGAWLGADAAIPLRHHNLIRAVAYELLKADPTQWETAERKAAELWLNSYKPVPTAENLEKVRGYLEAFEHYCEVKDWQLSEAIYTTTFESNELSLPGQMFAWGNYQDILWISFRLIEQASSQVKLYCLINLGNSYSCLGNARQASEYYQQARTLAAKVNDQMRESMALNGLGIAYRHLCNYQQAIDCHQRVLDITRINSDWIRHCNALSGLGATYSKLRKCPQAVRCYCQIIKISRSASKTGNSQLYREESSAIHGLGLLYHRAGKYEKAIKSFERSLSISRKLGDCNEQGNVLGSLGRTFVKLEKYSEALENFLSALEQFQSIGDRATEAFTYCELAKLHQKLGSTETALDYCDQVLALATELGIPLAEECEQLLGEINNQRER